MIHVFDFELLKGATENSHIKVIKDDKELDMSSITTDKDGNVLIILKDSDKGGDNNVL